MILFNILYLFLNTLAFPHAEQLWAVEPGFKCGREEKARIFVLCFLRPFALFFGSRSRARKREKSAGALL
jgi:hypothetical protein